MVRPSTATFGRWGAPEGPVDLREAGRALLEEEVGTPRHPSVVPEPAATTIEPSRLDPQDEDALVAVVGDWVSRLHEDLLAHAAGCSLIDYLRLRSGDPIPAPGAVVRPENGQQVGELLRACSARGLSVVPFGGGTSVVGGVDPAGSRTIAVALDRMDHVLAVDELNGTVTVEPGITGPVLERRLNARGLTLGHLPQSWERATIGGYVATRSAGQASTGYGRADEMVEAITVATPTEDLVLGRVHRSAAGPDLRQLFIGSEGALGIITSVTLRVRRCPSVTRYEGLIMPSYARGLAAFRELAQLGLRGDVMRLSDEAETRTTMAMSGPTGRVGELLGSYLGWRGVDEGAMVILGWEGHSKRVVAARRSAAWSVLRHHGAVSLGASVGRSWRKHRFSGPFLRDELLDRGYIVETLETAAPWRALPRLKAAVATALARSLRGSDHRPYVMCHVSHVYETGASLYFTVIDVAQDDPVAQWSAAKRAASTAIMDSGGTITHHHAVGRDHSEWLADEWGPGAVALLTDVKRSVDPNGIMNPGTLIPD